MAWMRSIILVMVLFPYEPGGNEGRGETRGKAGMWGSTTKVGLHCLILDQAHPGYLWEAHVSSLTSQEILVRADVKAKPTLAHYCWGTEEEEAAAASSPEPSSEMHRAARGAEHFNPISHIVFFVVTTT